MGVDELAGEAFDLGGEALRRLSVASPCLLGQHLRFVDDRVALRKAFWKAVSHVLEDLQRVLELVVPSELVQQQRVHRENGRPILLSQATPPGALEKSGGPFDLALAIRHYARVRHVFWSWQRIL